MFRSKVSSVRGCDSGTENYQGQRKCRRDLHLRAVTLENRKTEGSQLIFIKMCVHKSKAISFFTSFINFTKDKINKNKEKQAVRVSLVRPKCASIKNLTKASSGGEA